jgi:predicted Zn-ribbon and HTH transcriptional regulator
MTDKDDMHLHRLVTCVQCTWSGRSGELIARDKIRCPKCDSPNIQYIMADPPKKVQ